MSAEKSDVLIVGGGPAGLFAAERVSASGRRAILADHKASVGRKFLVAGRGGLNLTHSEPVAQFPARYHDASGRWARLLADFSPEDLRAWAKGLGVETFVGTSGRVFPETKQAAPLLRRWIERLRKQGVSFRARHRLEGFRRDGNEWEISFATSGDESKLRARMVIFALGGASWPQTGSDGGWVRPFEQAGIEVAPLVPANGGYEIEWPPNFLAQAEGQPLKNITVQAGAESVAGELLVTRYGLEGGALYQLGCALREMHPPQIHIDLKPSFTALQLAARLGPAKPSYLLAQADAAWHLGPASSALLRLLPPPVSAEALAATAKSFPLTLRGPRPIDEAISSAGGVRWEQLDERLMLRAHPGLFCAGEMIDWEAPTGGYLLQGCFSTAHRAAQGALGF